MKLVGSTTSPYVRRTRLWLANENYEFINLNIFDAEERKVLQSYNPAMKVPMLLDGDQPIFDSRVIFRYLNNKLQRETLTWHDENLLTLIDNANDSLVTILLSKRSGFELNDDKLIIKLQHERINNTFAELEQAVQNGDFDHWHYPAICLFCLLDWTLFRELHDLAAYPALNAFKTSAMDKPMVTETDPRL